MHLSHWVYLKYKYRDAIDIFSDLTSMGLQKKKPFSAHEKGLAVAGFKVKISTLTETEKII